MFKLEIATDNAAFEDAPARELARMLRDVAKRIENGHLSAVAGGNILDVNGNTCGYFTHEPD